LNCHCISPTHSVSPVETFLQLHKSTHPSLHDADPSTEKPKPVKPPEPIVEISSDESGSDEDIPAQVAVKLLNNTLRPIKPSFTPVIKPDPESQEQDDEDEVLEKESNHSSPRESRSPVIFNQNKVPPIPRSASLSKLAKTIDDEATQSGTDSPSGEEDDNADSYEEESQSESEEQEPKTTVQVPQSSPDLPRPKQATKTSPPTRATKATSQSQSQKQRKMVPTPASRSSSDSGFSTQDEVDFQLTSSLYEAHSQYSQAVKSTPILPPSSQTARPGFRIGASLQSLNEKRPTLAPSMTSSQVNGKTARQKLREQEESSEESDSDSDSDSSSSDDEENNPSAQLILQQSQSRGKESTTNSDTSSDEDSEDESGDDEARNARNDLAAAIANIGSQSSTQSQAKSQTSGKSPKAILSSQVPSKSRKAGKEFKGKRKDDKYLTKYQFSQYT
jgi:hypothetical protein